MGDLAHRRHLPGPQLVQDLARLRVAAVVRLGRLEPRQHGQRVTRDAGPDGQHLERGDDGVATEQGVVPGDAGRDVSLAREWARVDEQAQVGHAPVKRAIGGRVRAGHVGGGRVPGTVCGLGIVAGARTGRWTRLLPWRQGGVEHLGRDPDIQGLLPTRWDEQPERQQHPMSRPIGIFGRRHHSSLADGGRADPRPPESPVEPGIAEPDESRRDVRLLALAACDTFRAAHLEDVGEVGVKGQGQHAPLRMQRVVLDPDSLLERIRDDPVAHHSQGLARQDGRGIAVLHGVARQVRVGHLDGASPAGAAARPEHHRPLVVEPQLVPRQHPRVAQVQAQTALVAPDIAVRVAEQEAAVVLEDQRAGQLGGALDARVLPSIGSPAAVTRSPPPAGWPAGAPGPS